MLRIRQIVLAAHDLQGTVATLQSVLKVSVCYRDPEIATFGLENALMTIGCGCDAQFLEVVSPLKENTAAGRHLARHGDSGYMLILQTDDLKRDRARIERLGVRIVWEAAHADISAIHLHPKDIGAAIVSIDQSIPPDSWRWAGPNWQRSINKEGAQRIVSTTIAAQDPIAMAQRWSTVLGMNSPIEMPHAHRIDLDDAILKFVSSTSDVIAGFGITLPDPKAALRTARKQGLPVNDHTVTICGTRFELSE